jgi:hypothetical protein
MSSKAVDEVYREPPFTKVDFEIKPAGSEDSTAVYT